MATYEDFAILADSANANIDTYLHDIAENENVGSGISPDYIRDKYGLLVHTFWETAMMGMFLTSLTSDETIALLENTTSPLANDIFFQAPERTPTYVRFKSPISNIVTLNISMSWIFKWINRLNDCIDRYMPIEMHKDLKVDSVAFAYYDSSKFYSAKRNDLVPIGTFWAPRVYLTPTNGGGSVPVIYRSNKSLSGFYIHGKNLKNAYLSYPNDNERALCFSNESKFNVVLNRLTGLWRSSNGVFNESESINLESSGIPYMIQTGASITPFNPDSFTTLLRPCFHKLNDLTATPYYNTHWCAGRIHPVFFNKRGETLNNPCFGWDVTSGLANLFSQVGYRSLTNENVSITQVANYNYVNTTLYNWYMNYDAATGGYSQMGSLSYTINRVYNSNYYSFPDYDKLFSVYGRNNNFVFKIPASNMYTANGYPYRVYPNFGNIGEYGGLCYNSSIRMGRTNQKAADSLVDPNLSGEETYAFQISTRYKGAEGLVSNDVAVVP